MKESATINVPYQTQYSETKQMDKRDICPPDEDDERDVIIYEEVERAVIHLKKNKSPGTDGVVGEMIKAGGDEMIQAIHEICKQVGQEGTVPKGWSKNKCR